MKLKKIYSPIEDELREVEDILEASLKKSRWQSLRRIGSYILESPGKRIRPALLILAAKATNGGCRRNNLTEIASAMELIHMASLIHDDTIDRARIRHFRPTVYSKWGGELSIALGDYLYSLAFRLLSKHGDTGVLQCISFAVEMMCEGELLQVWERGNLNLTEARYIHIIKKKTAILFSACCEIGGLISDNSHSEVLKTYGMNLGIAFQIIDDYLDLAGEGERLGKEAGQDIRSGEMTLPILKLWKTLPPGEKKELKKLFTGGERDAVLKRIRERFFDSGAATDIKETVTSFITSARENINGLSDSPYKNSLLNVTDYIIGKGFNGKKELGHD